MINILEVNETNKMIEKDNLDVRTITLGINLMDCIDSDLKRLKEKRIDAAGLIVHRFPLEGLTEGFGIMKDKTEDYIKIMGIFGY